MPTQGPPISDPEDTEEPAGKRYETRDELYGALLKAVLLQSPQGPSQAAVELSGLEEVIRNTPCRDPDCGCEAVIASLRSDQLAAGGQADAVG